MIRSSTYIARYPYNPDRKHPQFIFRVTRGKGLGLENIVKPLMHHRPYIAVKTTSVYPSRKGPPMMSIFSLVVASRYYAFPVSVQELQFVEL
jgi:hypothetical protein